MGFLPYIIVSSLDAANQHHAAEIVHIVFIIIDPTYTIFGGLYYINRVYLVHTLLNGVDVPVPFDEYFTWSSNLPVTYIIPVIQAIAFYFLLRFSEIKRTGWY